ncbi:cytochrome P450 [Nocardioides sp.]|uniref:cytochrome P450 n=1 Tax=Nocardioides sp. TaxID=35761 RepID=UPI00378321C7
MTATASPPIVFDPYDYGFQEDPYPTYRRCRDEDPLHHNPDLDVWVLTRHADIEHAVRSVGTYSNAMGVSIDKSAWGPDAHRVMSFLGMDPPRQTRLRRLVSKGFTPRRVAELAPQIQRLTDLHLTRCLEEGSFDWIHDFAGRLPMDVISEMMGVPESDRAEVRRLADLLVHREPGVRDVPPEGSAAALTLVVYFTEMVESRKKRPTDDLTSALLAASIDADRLTEEEIIAFLFLMVVAGNETTTKLLGHALFHLTRHPEQYDRVFADPEGVDDLVTPWIEETLRYDTSSQMVARHLLRDVELHGKVAPAGSKALLVLGSANRDDRVFEDPDRFDIFRDKEELARLLSFGGGRHFCLGANLARLEARIALTELVRRVGSVEVDHDASVRVHSINVRGFASVPVRTTLRGQVAG